MLIALMAIPMYAQPPQGRGEGQGQRRQMSEEDIERALTTMLENGVDYHDGIDEGEQQMVSKLLTNITNSAKLIQALDKKKGELPDFVVQQLSRG